MAQKDEITSESLEEGYGNILLFAPLMSDACVELLTPSSPETERVLAVTTRTADEWFSYWEETVGETPSKLGVITVGDIKRSATTTKLPTAKQRPNDLETVETVPSLSNLARLGATIIGYVNEWEDADQRLVVCFDCLSELINEVGPEKSFKFLHLLTNRLKKAEATAHFHLNPEEHDSSTVDTLRTLFDDVARDNDEFEEYKSEGTEQEVDKTEDTPDPIRVLLVDDDPDFTDLIATYIEKEKGNMDVVTANNVIDALDRLEEEQFDCVISDYKMPETDGLEFLRTTRVEYPDLPFILLTGKGDEEVATEAISAGVTDYIPKGSKQYKDLSERIERNATRDRNRDVDTGERSPLNVYKSAFESAGQPIFISDSSGIIQYVNPRFEDLTGYQEDEILGGDFRGLVSDEYDDEFYEDVWKTVVSGDIWEGILLLETKSNEEVSTFHTLTQVSKEKTDANRVVGIIVNITEIENRQRELRREKERLEELVETLVHDLRNPLGVAKGNLEMIVESQDDIEHSLDRMEEIMQKVLELARYDEIEEMTWEEVSKTAEDAWRMVMTDEAELVIDNRALVMADHDQLARVFENLFKNAVEYGGDDVVIEVGAFDNGLYVEDNGPGIPEKEREKIFEFGYSTNDTGTGFGLAIVKRIVESHGWEIEVSEGQRGGARFEITGVDVQDDKEDIK